MKNLTYTLGPEDGWQRLDAFLSKALEGRISREKIKKAVLRGRVLLNGSPCLIPKTRVAAGDVLEIELAEPQAGPAAEDGELDVLYRDADLAVINKPAGLTVHPCPSRPEGTLVNRLLTHFPELSCRIGAGEAAELVEPAEDEEPVEEFEDWQEADDETVFAGVQEGDRPGIVHRLDKDTTGLILVALNEASRLKLASDFALRRVKKEYLALVYGVPAEPEGRIDAPIGRDPAHKTRMAVLPSKINRDGEYTGCGRDALSEYRLLYADPSGRFSLLAVRIHTGRTHQIRVHLRHIGHPIVGDATYFDLNALKPLFATGAGGVPVRDRASLQPLLRRVAARPLLHAWRISFEHPRILEPAKAGPGAEEGGAEMSFHCPPPEDFFSAARELSQSMQRVVLTGNSGCGKSSVLERLKEAGVPVWSADQAVAESYETGGDGWHMLRAAFGGRFVPSGDDGAAPSAPVNKKALFKAMCEDDVLRREVERIVHPIAFGAMRGFFAREDFWSRPAAWEELSPALAVAEVPLYFESVAPRGLNETEAERPLTVGVHCPYEIRSARLKKFRRWPDAMIEKMESWQWPEDKKMRACDLLLDNSGDLAALDRAVARLLSQLAELREKRLLDIVTRLRALAGCEAG